MAEHSSIEWTDATWNPITGCSIKSPGCRICYAMKLAATRLKHHPSRKGLTKEVNGHHVWTGEVRFNEKWLDQPLRWARPRMVFVCAHGDLFHESVPDAWIDRVFAVMALAPHHTFQVLTKRSDRMRAYFTKRQFRDTHPLEVRHDAIDAAMNDIAPTHWCKRELEDYSPEGLPLPNVWLGVSAERQQEADERIPDLLYTPAAVRFVSLEPLLGPIDITPFLHDSDCRRATEMCTCCEPREVSLDWIIVGGESGDGASPMHPAWVRALRDQCAAAGKLDRFFFKQWGAWAPYDRGRVDGAKLATPYSTDEPLQNFGKKLAGRLLDGVTHNGMPR